MSGGEKRVMLYGIEACGALPVESQGLILRRRPDNVAAISARHRVGAILARAISPRIDRTRSISGAGSWQPAMRSASSAETLKWRMADARVGAAWRPAAR